MDTSEKLGMSSSKTGESLIAFVSLSVLQPKERVKLAIAGRSICRFSYIETRGRPNGAISSQRERRVKVLKHLFGYVVHPFQLGLKEHQE